MDSDNGTFILLIYHVFPAICHSWCSITSESVQAAIRLGLWIWPMSQVLICCRKFFVCLLKLIYTAYIYIYTIYIYILYTVYIYIYILYIYYIYVYYIYYIYMYMMLGQIMSSLYKSLWADVWCHGFQYLQWISMAIVSPKWSSSARPRWNSRNAMPNGWVSRASAASLGTPPDQPPRWGWYHPFFTVILKWFFLVLGVYTMELPASLGFCWEHIQ